MSDYSEVLIAPDGREVIAKSPSEYNDLKFGMGYREKREPVKKTTTKLDPRVTSVKRTASESE